MAQDNKVVSLREVQASRSVTPAALIRLRDASTRSLGKILSEFFDRADDVLFGMADRAGSNQDQVAYFDAMRELRVRRKAMGSSVLQWVVRAFNELGRFDPMPDARSPQQVDQDSLALMDDAELERKLAIEGLINKLGNRYSEQVRLLNLRIARVSGLKSLLDRQMPLSPEVICTGLAEATGGLEIDIRARLVVLKLFDRLLVDRLEELYRDANRLLISEGVLPEMKRVPVPGKQKNTTEVPRSEVSPSTPSAPGLADPAASGFGSRPVPPPRRPSTDVLTDDNIGGQYNFSELTALLHQADEVSGQEGTQRTAPLVDTAALMHRLSQLQSTEQTSADNAGVIPLATLLGQALPVGDDHRLQVNQVDGDVINLVAMLFEFILDDRQLAPMMKMLIGRLQIPVLKVALMDRSFFNRGGHPARKLLNELAMAGIGWTPKNSDQRDPLKEKIEYVVNRLLNEFTDNVSLFGELLAEFTHFMDLDRRRRELVEQRLRDAEEGRARQELARDQVNALLADLLTGRDLPARALALLEEPWRKHLEWVFLREGEESERWQQASRLTERLTWSLDPYPLTDSTRSELLRLIPEVTDALRSGLQEISWDPFATDAAIRDLELIHVDVLQGLLSAEAEPEPADREVPGVTESPEAPGIVAVEMAEPVAEASGEADGFIEELDALLDTLSGSGNETSGSDNEAAPEPVQETSVPDTGEPAETAPALLAEAETETEAATLPEETGDQLDPVWLERASGMRVGCWVEMQREQDQGRLRCKLAAIIRATGKYIFVNRNGAKVLEYRQEELARALASGQLMMLDDGLIFDRALESIIDSLRNNRKD